MSKLSSLINQIFRRSNGQVSTTAMRSGSETGQVYGLRLVKSIPFFGNKPFKDQYKILLFVLVPTALATAASVIYGGIYSSYTSQRIEISTKLQMLSQRTARLATQLSNGDHFVINELSKSVQDINDNLKYLKEGKDGLAASDGTAASKLDTQITMWKKDESQIKDLLDNSENLIDLKGKSTYIQDAARASNGLIESIRILQFDNQASDSTLHLTSALASALSEMEQLMQTMLNATLIPEDAANNFDRIKKVTNDSVNSLTKGDEKFNVKYVDNKLLIAQLKDLKVLTNIFTSDVSGYVNTLNGSKSAKQAAYNVSSTADDGLAKLKELTDEYIKEKSEVDQINTLSISLAITALLIGFFWIWLKLQETRLTTAQVEESIMHLMTDLMSISDGNLSTRARVAENITGSIADSLNLTIARLNRTLSDVKESSQTVRDGADQMTNDAAIILEAVRDQSNKIKEASSSVNSIADSVQAVAFAAEQSSDVAVQQRKVTEEGREAVAETIAAMNAIRDQIQNTAKRIKRVGESAQEIDEIIELISDTTEQTNVLAMNASIQAAAAGEAGRGFRAVATEVQRLAERSDQSLRKIVALIRTMQAETQNAVSAMESSTQEVVAGAQTTNKAGAALTKIEEVSSELNSLIAAITEATQQQTNEAKIITDRMNDILQISNSTARGVEQTTTGIQTIASLAEELDDAMDQFKLQ